MNDLVHFNNKKISDFQNEYEELIKSIDRNNYRHILLLILKNNNDINIYKTLLFLYIDSFFKIKKVDFNNYIDTIKEIIDMIFNKNNIDIILSLLEHNIDKDIITHIHHLIKEIDIDINFIFNLINKKEIDYKKIIILLNENNTEIFIREGMKKLENVNFNNKNFSIILSNLNVKYFINYKFFSIFLENDLYTVRNSFLEILENLILYFKEIKNLEAIEEITNILIERLNDINYFVRLKSLTVINNLFKNSAILNNKRNFIIKKIIERVKDKTVIVRKKSINILTQILINHPYKDIKNFNKIDQNHILIKEILEFKKLMEKSLKVINKLLSANTKTDILEISTFIKFSYLLKIKNSKRSLKKILNLIFTKEKEIIINIIKEIINKSKNILFEFINNKAFEYILKDLNIDEKIIFKNLKNNIKIYQNIKVLKIINRKISENTARELISFITEILFTSKTQEDLIKNIEIYNDILNILNNIKNRVNFDNEILKKLDKNIIKMNFYEKNVIKNTVKVFYSISSDPEKNSSRLLKHLIYSKNKLKILDCIGCIALSEFHFLEKLEKINRNKKINKEIYKEATKRLTLENISKIRENRKSLESIKRLSLEGKRLSLENKKMSLDSQVLNENFFSEKNEEEISDFFFILKENQILYSESLLSQYLPFLLKSCEEEEENVQAVAYLSLIKCMLISSRFFKENFYLYKKSLYSKSEMIKNNSICALHDFIIYYNTFIDYKILFDKLNDSDVRKNAILVIYNLIDKNIMRIKNYVIFIIKNLFDKNIGNIVKTLIKSFSSNNNIMSTIFYETFLSDLDNEFIKYLCPFVNLKIRESLFIKCVKTSKDLEKLKIVFNCFEYNNEFILKNNHVIELNQFNK